jgi:DNA (cytosine-5)-methyltransferase 1
MLKLLDLFSGIGGFSLGMEATNRIKTIAFVEKDKFCQKVLNKNFKNIPIEEDIRNVKGSNYTADIVSGGFPCQPFSVAGKRKGKDDDRYLWDETIRVVAETKPKWFVGENVEGIINISNGTVLQQIQQDLEKEGFQVQCLVIPASGVGAWHQRKRVWIIGCNVSNSNYSGCKDRTKQHRWEQTQNEKRFDSFSRSNIISNSNSNRNTNEIERSNGEKEKVQREHRQKDSSTWEFIRTNSNDVPNSNARLSFGENEEIQSRGTTFASSGKNVPNTNAGCETGCERQRRYAKRVKEKGHQVMLPTFVKLYPTPRACDMEGGVVKNVEIKDGTFSRVNKKGVRFGVKLTRMQFTNFIQHQQQGITRMQLTNRIGKRAETSHYQERY